MFSGYEEKEYEYIIAIRAMYLNLTLTFMLFQLDFNSLNSRTDLHANYTSKSKKCPAKHSHG